MKDLELLQIVVRQCKAAGMAEHKGVVKAEREIKRIELEAREYRLYTGRQMSVSVYLCGWLINTIIILNKNGKLLFFIFSHLVITFGILYK